MDLTIEERLASLEAESVIAKADRKSLHEIAVKNENRWLAIESAVKDLRSSSEIVSGKADALLVLMGIGPRPLDPTKPE